MDVEPRASHGPLDAHEWRRLRSIVHVEVRRRAFVRGAELVAIPGTKAVGLVLEPGLAPICDAYYTAHEVVRRVLPDVAAAEAEARSEVRQAADLLVWCLLWPASIPACLAEQVIEEESIPLIEVEPDGWHDDAVSQLTEWRRALLETAAHWAAEVPPGSDNWTPARWAVYAGREARERAEYDLAEGWFAIARDIAREHGDTDALSRAIGGMGRVHLCRGNFPKARKAFRVARWIGERGGHAEATAYALHDLGFALHKKDPHAANRSCRRAFQMYAPDNPYRLTLIRDVASIWIDQGHFRRALRVLLATLEAEHPDPDYLLMALGNIARAAAGAGDRDAYAMYSKWAWEWVLSGQPGWAKARTALHLAMAALTLGEWARSIKYAMHALLLADHQGEHEISHHAAVCLEAARAGRAVRWVAPPADPDADQFADEAARAFSRFANA